MTCGNAGHGALSCGPAVIGSNRLSTAVRGEYVGNTWGSYGHVRPSDSRGQRQRRLDARLRDLFLAIDALGVDPEEDFSRCARPTRRPGSSGSPACRGRGGGVNTRGTSWPRFLGELGLDCAEASKVSTDAPVCQTGSLSGPWGGEHFAQNVVQVREQVERLGDLLTLTGRDGLVDLVRDLAARLG